MPADELLSDPGRRAEAPPHRDGMRVFAAASVTPRPPATRRPAWTRRGERISPPMRDGTRPRVPDIVRDSFDPPREPAFRRRVRVLAAAMAAGFALVAIRLLDIQVFRGASAGGAGAAGIGGRLVAAPRGSIVASGGEVLAEDVPSYDIAVLPRALPLERASLEDFRRFNSAEAGERERLREELLRRLREEEPAVARISEATGVPRGELAEGIFRALRDAARNYAGDGGWFAVATGIPYEKWAAFKALNEDPFRGDRIPGVGGRVSFRRIYPFGGLAAHVVGTVGQLDARRYGEIARGVLPERSAPSERLWAALGRTLDEGAREALSGLLGCPVEDVASASELRTLAARAGCEDELIGRLGIERSRLYDGWDDWFRPLPAEMAWLPAAGAQGRRRFRPLPDPTIGETGIERRYNQRLRGKAGFVNASGKPPAEEAAPGGRDGDATETYAPARGGDVRLTLDLAIQRAAEEALTRSGRAGAAVLMNVEDGAVLALASFPSFDPNVFSSRRAEEVRALMSNPARPLLNRAIAGLYPPGSIIKPLVAIAAIEEGKVGPGEIFECSGRLQVGRWTFHCDQKRAHGGVDLVEAVGRSCNVTFYSLGARCGVDLTGRWAREAGLGEPTGIDLPAEAAGVLPDREWKARTFADRPGEAAWTVGNDMHLAIGQGYIRVTPLQMCTMMAWIANGGRRVTPHFAADGERPAAGSGRRISDRALDTIRRGLWHCVNCGTPGRRGTAYSAFHEDGPPLPIQVAGKTGTADHGEHGREPHAWFCGYAPFEKPEVAFAVLIEYGGHGGAAAAPIARRIIEAYCVGRAAPQDSAAPPRAVAGHGTPGR
ncbi:MAG: penicillin-binding transpeptidase domain-containing protein [Planctomycetota bacterium]|nr:penicillin-binding transpeptidase domain-containing protein [Planctomycetota bacterium]